MFQKPFHFGEIESDGSEAARLIRYGFIRVDNILDVGIAGDEVGEVHE